MNERSLSLSREREGGGLEEVKEFGKGTIEGGGGLSEDDFSDEEDEEDAEEKTAEDDDNKHVIRGGSALAGTVGDHVPVDGDVDVHRV